ncbi:glycine zipper 2TM domain-containing protein [Caulobacter segnis]|uniref:glycine zipper 2TM domain-containing protein n=1 Tax=Caulobacter segnis TaxID=88688 RepID=UPI00285D1E64|nr:glycine zipper 2TM domain-containing protein [Caulobacter segnis]MDR6626364.1 outer membrane lipoprotein SlyB [Caulobacter segnis]
MRPRLNALVLATVVGFTASSVVVTAANAQSRERYRVLVCNKSKAKNGAIIGGLGGALLGNTVAGRGNKTEGALLGGAVGAVAGHEIGKGKKKCHYEYRYRR